MYVYYTWCSCSGCDAVSAVDVCVLVCSGCDAVFAVDAGDLTVYRYNQEAALQWLTLKVCALSNAVFQLGWEKGRVQKKLGTI